MKEQRKGGKREGGGKEGGRTEIGDEARKEGGRQETGGREGGHELKQSHPTPPLLLLHKVMVPLEPFPAVSR